jgi:hypothetical protein
MEQIPLIDDSASSLPGPIFRPRPGWGGQLNAWFRANGAMLLFRTIVVGASIWSTSFIINYHEAAAPAPTLSPAPIALQAYTITARTGDTLTSVSIRALDEYLATSGEHLDRIEHLWAGDRITNALLSTSSRQYPVRPASGETVTIPATVIEYGIAEAHSLSVSQRHNLQKYVK